jgi:hypothetical protein
MGIISSENVKDLRRNEIMLVRLLELSWWFYIHEKKQLHEVIYMTSETPNRHRKRMEWINLKSDGETLL